MSEKGIEPNYSDKGSLRVPEKTWKFGMNVLKSFYGAANSLDKNAQPATHRSPLSEEALGRGHRAIIKVHGEGLAPHYAGNLVERTIDEAHRENADRDKIANNGADARKKAQEYVDYDASSRGRGDFHSNEERAAYIKRMAAKAVDAAKARMDKRYAA